MVKVSIIIPTFNHAHLISRSLQSLIDQTYKDWEAIVVNNFSKDNTVEVVESFGDSRIKLINFNNNGIIAAGRNKGISTASGEYIAFLDSDDWWYKDKLEMSLKYLENNDIVYHDLDFCNSSGLTGKVNKGRKLERPVFDDLILHGNEIINSSVVVRRELVEKVGGLNENPLLFGIEDCDLWIRISQHTEKFHYISNSLGAYWVDENNNSRPSKDYIKRFHFLYSQYLSSVTESKRKAAQAFQSYAVTRQAHLSGELKSCLPYFKAIPHLDRNYQKLKAFLFGIHFLFLRS